MPRWRKLATVIRREYLTRVRTRAFWISTVLVPVLILAFTVLPQLLVSSTGGVYTIAVVTRDAALVGEMERLLAAKQTGDTGITGKLVVHLRRVAPEADAAAQREALKREVLAKKLSGVVIVPAGVLAGGGAEYISTNVSAFRLISRLQGAVHEAVVHERLLGAGIGGARADAITSYVDLRAVRVSPDLSESGRGAEEKSFFLSYALTFLLYMTMIFHGYYVMRGVLEEKSSRIVEVVVANIRPTELMLGKIFGVGAVGLTQYALWVFVILNLAVLGSLVGSPLAEGQSAYVSPALMVFFVLFFVLGFFQYAAIYAAVGAAFNTEEEAQQMQTVVSLVLACSFMLMFAVMANPDSTVSVVLSLVPLFAPMLFFMRMTIQFPPVWQIALCLVLLLGSVFATARVAAAVYRVGILMYGKKPTLGEVLRWARTA